MIETARDNAAVESTGWGSRGETGSSARVAQGRVAWRADRGISSGTPRTLDQLRRRDGLGARVGDWGRSTPGVPRRTGRGSRDGNRYERRGSVLRCRARDEIKGLRSPTRRGGRGRRSQVERGEVSRCSARTAPERRPGRILGDIADRTRRRRLGPRSDPASRGRPKATDRPRLQSTGVDPSSRPRDCAALRGFYPTPGTWTRWSISWAWPKGHPVKKLSGGQQRAGCGRGAEGTRSSGSSRADTGSIRERPPQPVGDVKCNITRREDDLHHDPLRTRQYLATGSP